MNPWHVSPGSPARASRPGDVTEFYEPVQAYTMTTPQAVTALAQAVERIVLNNIPGALVECGVWKGGSVMAMALVLQALGKTRDLWLVDTFAGMVAPGPEDGDLAATAGRCVAALPEVRRNVESTGYPPDRIHTLTGDVCLTLPRWRAPALALLRLDTDWYASTRCELEYLWPHLASGGCLIVDDYHCWPGSQRAVDEYFAEHGPLTLTPLDHVAVMGWKR